MTLNIQQLSAFDDNYIYILTCTETGITAVVDPGDADTVRHALGNQQLNYILCTHHHNDHIGGNEELCDYYDCTVIAPEDKRIPNVNHHVKEWDTFNIGSAEVTVIPTAGHTKTHVSYYIPSANALFCGDTLFAGGCGRLFEGTAEDLFESFRQIRALPNETNLYCAHEYTLSNFKFATAVSPEARYSKALQWAEKCRIEGKPTVPTTLEVEKYQNIFLRAENARELKALRNMKDIFKE